MSWFDMSYEEACDTTVDEFEMYSLAHQLKLQDQLFVQARSAFYNMAIQETTGGKNPKPKYRNFEEFYDYNKELKAILNPPKNKKRQPTLADINRIIEERTKMKGGN